METPQTFAEIVKAKRIALKLSQGAFGNLLGVGQAAVSAWERGESLPDLTTTLERFAQVAELPYSDLLALALRDKSAKNSARQVEAVA